MSLKQEVQNLIRGEVRDDKTTIANHTHDASIFEVTPELVVYPKDAGDIKALVSFATLNKKTMPHLSLTARAAGTGMSGGSLNESIIVDVTKHLNVIGEVDTANKTVTVAPGAYFRDLEKKTLAHGLIMPSYPASKNLCAVGGIVANNSGGEKTLSYGSTKDYVTSLKAVLADGKEYTFAPIDKKALKDKMAQNDFEGEIYRRVFDLIERKSEIIKKAKPDVSKNSTGYFIWDVWDGTSFDMSKLFVGSQGTLGIITETTFKLVHPKPHSTLLVMFLRDLAPLADIVTETLKHKPESFESYDDHTFNLAVRFLPDLLKSLKMGIIPLALSFLPEFKMMLSGGKPKLILLAEFTGDTQKEAQEKAVRAQEALAAFNIPTRITTSRRDADKYWTVRRESFNLLRHHIKKGRTAPFIDDTIVRPERMPEFLPRLNEIMSRFNITYTIAGHIGDGNLHIIPIMDFTKPESRRIFKKLSEQVFDLVFEFGGSMSAEHNDGIVRTPYLKKMYGEEMYHVFEEIKNIFDPHNIFNPGKKIGITMEYALKHMDTDNK